MIGILTIIGSIGLFLYGMKLMSGGLQKIVGDSLRSMLSVITRNRFTGMLTGILVTALVQSSRSTTVTIVSFVNAGILSLSDSLAVILGANVGTTATTWIIAVFGFCLAINPFIFALIALALPLLNTQRVKSHNWGELLLGFSLLFLALSILEQYMPTPSTYPACAAWIQEIASMGIVSDLIFLAMGLLLTVIVQASSATFAIILLLIIYAWIPFEAGCAMIVGSNIGTCITPLMASLSANTMAKRAAAGHLLFNLLGAVWALPLVSRTAGWLMAEMHPAVGLALFHTAFNALNVCLMLGFIKWIEKGITRIIPDGKDRDESFKLKFISNGFIESGEMALLQVRKETSRYGADTYNMFSYVKTMLSENISSDRQQELFQTVREMEAQSDAAEEEIADYLNKISPKTLSADSELLSRSYYKMIDELESVADSIYHIACTLKRKYEHRVRFTREQQKNLKKMIELTDASMTHMVKCLEYEDLPESSLNKAYNYEDEINNFRTQLRNEMLELKAIEYEQATYFMDIINECERVGDFVINVLTAMTER